MMKRIRLLALVLCSFFFLGACGTVYTAKGVRYRVRPGDTLESVAHKFKKDPQDIAEVNNIDDEEQLKEGRSIYIPGVSTSGLGGLIEHEVKKTKKKEKHKEDKEKKEEKKKNEKKKKEDKKEEDKQDKKKEKDSKKKVIEVNYNKFDWPILGELSSLYGIRHGRKHDGIDITSPIGTPVKAAADGEVVLSKRMRGYGNIVLVRHKDDFFTVYSHNSVNLAKVGDKVKKGDVISKVGRTGRATGPHLHFEVREGTKSRNPLFFLPKNQYAEQAQGKAFHDENSDTTPEGEVDIEDKEHFDDDSSENLNQSAKTSDQEKNVENKELKIDEKKKPEKEFKESEMFPRKNYKTKKTKASKTKKSGKASQPATSVNTKSSQKAKKQTTQKTSKKKTSKKAKPQSGGQKNGSQKQN